MAKVETNGALTGHQRTRAPGLATELSRSAAERFTAKGFKLPLDFLMEQFQEAAMQGADPNDKETAIDCAKAALPFVHPKLSAVEVDGTVTAKHEQALAELDDDVPGDNPPAEHNATTVIPEPVTDAAH
jgi:hypothetical protein